MRPSLLSLLPAAVGLVSARALPESHVVHERRDDRSSEWVKRDRVAPHLKVPVRIGLKQSKDALEMAHEWLMDVSHPASGRYGQHWYGNGLILYDLEAADSDPLQGPKRRS